MGDLDLVMILWTHVSQPPKRYLDHFSRFCMAHLFAKHTLMTHRQCYVQHP